MLRPTSQVGIHLLPHPACIADGDRRAHRLQQTERRREDVAADEVEDRVDLLELADLLVRHRLDGAERARQLELLRAADRRDRRAVQRADDLHGRRTHGTRGSGDQHARAERDAHELGQRDPRR